MSYHLPIMTKEVIKYLDIKENGIYVDCTTGGGGHSYEILKRLGPEGHLFCFDQDQDALDYAKKRMEDFENVSFIHSNFVNIRKKLEELNIFKIDGALMDIGVSSYQIDTAERGFSYMQEGPLDMRMNQGDSLTASDIINNYSETELTDIFKNYGEERFSPLISKKIVKERQRQKIESTLDLVEIIREAIPQHFLNTMKGHPAKKVFQALRIEVNGELGVLKESILEIVDLLNPKGRLVILTFHSLEDRIVKNEFRELEKDCICPPEIPICMCEKKKEVKVLTRRPIIPSEEEMQKNLRAKSCKLRACERLGS